MFATPQAFLDAARRSVIEPPAGVDLWYPKYYRDLADPRGLRTYLRAKEQLLDLVGGPVAVQDKVVMDAGSGFGMVSNVMAIWGARQVIALELFAPMSYSHKRVLSSHFPKLRDRVWAVRGDVTAMPAKSGSVDLLLSIEAISHYYDVEAFLGECARVLRPGGWLLVSDSNNGANPGLRRFTEQLWERFELGPAGPFGDRDVGESMQARRERIIAARFAELPAARVRTLAENTSGLVGAEIERAVAEHLAGGPAPALPYRRGTLPREPEWGYVLEALFDPPALARRVARHGFRVRAVAHYGGARGDLVMAANLVLRVLPGFRFARAFRVVARRT